MNMDNSEGPPVCTHPGLCAAAGQAEASRVWPSRACLEASAMMAQQSDTSQGVGGSSGSLEDGGLERDKG